MRLYQFALATLGLAFPAHAGIADLCVAAYERGDDTSGEKYAKTVLDTRTPNLRSSIESGTKCLKFFGYGEFAYDPDTRRFTKDKAIIDREKKNKREMETAREAEKRLH